MRKSTPSNPMPPAGTTPASALRVGLATESTANMNTKFVGRLGLSDEEENALVSFMQALTDGYMLR